MPTVPTTEPTRAHAGDSLTWRRDDLTADYPATAGWSLTYTLVSPTKSISVAAAADGDAFLVTVAASATAGWPAGDYTWAAAVTNGAQRTTIGQGRITVLPNVAGALGGLDVRSPARQALDAVNAALASYGAKAYLQEIQTGDRRQKFSTPGEFMAFRSRLMREVAQEDVAAGLRPSGANRLLVRFRR
jgi:hypothetical protein